MSFFGNIFGYKQFLLEYRDVLLLITTVSFITLVIMYIIGYFIQIELSHLNKISLSNILKVCKTGDLIITRWDHVDIGYRLFCKYCHVGMIYKDPETNNVFLIETHPEEFDDSDINNEFPRSGVNMYPLKERIENYQGTCYFLKLKKNVVKKFDFEKYAKIPFSTDFRYSFLENWFYNKLNITKEKVELDNTMYCSELIGHILKDLNILDKTIKINTLSPDSFETLTDFNTRLYENSIKIKCVVK